MKNLPRRVPAAILFVSLILSAPLWLPSLQALAAPTAGVNLNPFEYASAFYILDAGWTSGSLTQQVLAVPQVLAWTPGQKEAAWAAETGFIYGGFRDAETGRIYITEQRNTNYESLLNVTFAGDVLYANNSDWFMHLTTLDGDSGEVMDRTMIDMPAQNARGSALQPIGVSGKTLYLMNFAYGENLFAFDLVSQKLSEQSWSLCEHGYLVEAELISAPTRVAALCVGHSSGTASAVTLTNLESNEQSSLKIPVLGTEEYQTSNGIFVANNALFAIDSEAGILVGIDMDTMQIAETSNYREGLAQQQSSWPDNLIGWLGEQIVRPAAAKRWMALTAVSPDGHWVIIDGGVSGGYEASKELLLVDLKTLKAVRSFELGKSPVQIEFGSDGNLLVMFNKRNVTSDTPGVLLDVATGEQQTVALPTHGWIRGIMPAN